MLTICLTVRDILPQMATLVACCSIIDSSRLQRGHTHSELPDYTTRQLSLLDTSLGQALIKGQQDLCDANPNTGRTLAFQTSNLIQDLDVWHHRTDGNVWSLCAVSLYHENKYNWSAFPEQSSGSYKVSCNKQHLCILINHSERQI